MIEFKNKDYPNLHLQIEGVTIKVTVTLNISKDMIPYLPEKTTCFSNKRYVHFISYNMNLIQANEKFILNVANTLIHKLMINTRIAKSKVKDNEANKLKDSEKKLIFTSSN